MTSRLAPRLLLSAFGLVAVAFAGAASTPGCTVGYVVRSAWFQTELLASREPVEKARARLSAEQQATLDLFDEVRRYGESLGLKPTRNYTTFATGWDREIWTVVACPPLAFEPRTWWFPIVGRVPYLGFFRPEDRDRWKERLEARGYDVHVRTAATYSTLGWFRDPILPGMLRWTEPQLASVVMHELAHATVWIPGSVAFNESFASFAGDELAIRYLQHRYGPDSQQVHAARNELLDDEAWRTMLHGLYGELDAVYRDPALSEAQKRARKAELLASLPERTAALPLHDRTWYDNAARRGDWNNARLIQFRTYNSDRARFQAVLDRNGGDMLAFMREIGEIAREPPDAATALARAVEPTAASGK